MNNYKSSVLQTKKALDLKDTNALAKKSTDEGIFYDALDCIEAVKKIGFNVGGIIAINKSFSHSQEEDPDIPGHLRNAYYNADDAIIIITDPNGTTKDAYHAQDVVSRNDLQEIVDTFEKSDKTRKDAWRVFASISKLQPFQDGNKRTALIAANAALNTFENENYLILPFNSIDHAQFMVDLMRFYNADSRQAEDKVLDRMMEVLPNEKEVNLHKPLTNEEKINPIDVKTKRIKSFYKDTDQKKE